MREYSPFVILSKDRKKACISSLFPCTKTEKNVSKLSKMKSVRLFWSSFFVAKGKKIIRRQIDRKTNNRNVFLNTKNKK